MTATPELIDALVADLRPVPAGTVWRRIAIGVGVGGLVSAVLMVLWLGLRADLAEAVWTTSYWAKFIYPLLLGIAGVLAVERLGRPGGRARRAARLAVVAVVAVLLLAAAQFMNSPPEMYEDLLMGSSAMLCPFYIVSLATPIYLGLLWALRGLAPTRLTVAGAGAGLLAGGMGAWIYAFHCGETAMPFLATWYSLGIVASVALGALAGRYMLRW